ncbi:glycerophosphodiester phosphodiesterase [Algihabitans albus]|uniref:glycerophosphodiester phosphodiesterase n=1 Tax=Algihabitans albus TaxID=2164067 RepID=UPI000E5CB60D|nr:glycerophosphodiester phosphodiesterase [Algihabitans albus]
MLSYAFLQSNRPLAFAHRGGALEAPENTLAAFAHAVGLGYRYIETDIQATRDGVAVVFHDDDLARLAGRPQSVSELDWSELRHLRVAGEPIPRFDELLAAWPELRINLEPKSDSAVVPMVEAIRNAGALDRVCVGCFQEARVRRLRELLGPALCWSPGPFGVFRVWATGYGLPLGVPDCGALQVPTQFRGIPLVTRNLIRAAHARDIQVHVWTVDERAEMERLLDLGVDGLMTDRPSLLRDVLQCRGVWS